MAKARRLRACGWAAAAISQVLASEDPMVPPYLTCKPEIQHKLWGGVSGPKQMVPRRELYACVQLLKTQAGMSLTVRQQVCHG